MAGVDYMTIAAWVGHKDGGVLIGKVYGHLSDDHKRETAKRLATQPAPTPSIEVFVQSITQDVAAAAGLSPQRDASRLDSRNVLPFPVAR
jgi:hypothetical protein